MSPTWKGKKYKLHKSDNFEEFLKALGVSYLLRKLANSAVPVIELIEDGDYYILRQESVVRNIEIRFKPDEEFIEQTPDGRTTRTVIVFETENKLIQRQLDGKPVEIIREFTDKDLIMTLTVANVQSTRYYKLIE